MKRCFLRGVALHPATVIISCFHYRLRDSLLHCKIYHSAPVSLAAASRS